MDRWFASHKLFNLLEAHHVYFIARTKSDKRVQLPWDPSWYKHPIGELSFLEIEITYRTHTLRLIRSELRPGMKDPEPWFLLTNLPEARCKGDAIGVTRCQILNRYRERFEIEEVFKDVKWLQRLKWQSERQKSSVASCSSLSSVGGYSGDAKTNENRSAIQRFIPRNGSAGSASLGSSFRERYMKLLSASWRRRTGHFNNLFIWGGWESACGSGY